MVRTWKQILWFMSRHDSQTVELEPLHIEQSGNEDEPSSRYYDAESFTEEQAVLTKSDTTVPHDGSDEPLSANRSLRELFFPSDLPKEVQLLRRENLAIPACYLIVGTMQGMSRPLLNVWPLDLSASEAQQTTLATIATLPAAFKILFGFWSDNFPIAGYRRKPYMFVGWFLCSSVMFVLMELSDTTISHVDPDDPNNSNVPSIQLMSLCFFLFGIGLWLADVMADSLVAQKARLEPENRRGNLQSTCYASRFFGLMVAAPISTYLYSSVGPSSVVTILMIGPLFMLPLIACLGEDTTLQRPHIRDQVAEIWRTVCSRAVWQPLGFLYLFNLLQVSNAAWRQFLSTNLHFTGADLNTLLVISYVLLYAGTMTYKFFFLHTSWRRLYQVCILLNGILSGLQLLLIVGKIPWGLSPFWFALGDDAVAEFLTGIQFLPCAILMMSLCPVGSEGAAYAMFTTVWNSAMMLAPAISSRMLGIWDVSKAALEAGQLQGMFNLTVLTTLIQVSPILFIGLLPSGREELDALSEKPYSGSRIGGGIFLLVLFGSMLYTFVVAILNIVEGGRS